MNYQITINYNDLKALSYIAAKKDVRDYLHGVHINIEDGYLEASNGAHAMRIKLSPPTCPPGVKNIILTNDNVGFILKSCKSPNGLVSLTIDTDANTVQTNGVTLPLYAAVDIQYPQFSRVFPKADEVFTREMTAWGFDTGLLAAYGKALKVLFKNDLPVFAPEFFGKYLHQCAYCAIGSMEYVIMGCRDLKGGKA